VLGTAYFQARRRGRNIGLALVLLALAVGLFVVAGMTPWPQRTPPSYPAAMVVISIALLALSMAVVLWRGFRK
jgi:peptidoglycan/LPS O-acetylase OafA/YrhL